MHHLRTFFHFHHGTPSDRAVKVVGSFAMALTLALTATAMTAVTATSDGAGSALHLAYGCPTPDGPSENRVVFDGEVVHITWTTTAPAAENEVHYQRAFDPAPNVVRASGDAALHTATLGDDLAPGTTYQYILRSQHPATGADVRSGTCVFTTPGRDVTPPIVGTLTPTHVGSTEATFVVVADDGVDAWLTSGADGVPTRTSARAFPDPRSGSVTFTMTLTDLRPGTTYTVEAAVRDVHGRVGTSEATNITTARSGAEDTNPPSLTAVHCSATDLGVVVRAVVSEVDARGMIEYHDGTALRTIEAFQDPTPERDGTILTRTISTAIDLAAITVRVVVLDAAGNVARSDPVTCER